MLAHHSLTQLKSLRLEGMARAFEEQMAQPGCAELSFEERIAMIIDREVSCRDTKRVDRLLKQARLKTSSACLEDVDYRAGRGLERKLLAALGSGQTWIACALGNAACRQGLSVQYIRLPRLFEELRIAHGDGSFGKRLSALAKMDLLLIDDWGLAPPSAKERSDLLEVLDDRVAARSTVITSQLPIEHWHEYLGDPTLADAILDRLLHSSHKLALTGESMRKKVKS